MKEQNVESISALSPQQQGMLLDTLSAPTPGVHVEQGTYLLRGPLAPRAFELAWQSAVDRHAILRTAFVWKNQDEPLQVTFKRLKVSVERADWSGLSGERQREALDAFLAADRRRGFDLSAAPLMRLTLFALSEDAHQFVWSQHHLIVDGWSLPLVLRDVSTFYEAYRSGGQPHVEASRPYRDYVAWLRAQDNVVAEAFWRKTLQGFVKPTPLGLPDASQAPARAQPGYGSRRIRLSESTTSHLQSFARQNHVTLNALIQGAWAALLARYSGEDDVVFGTTVSGRPAELPEVGSMVGPFLNTLPFRVQVDRRAPVRDWLRRIQAGHLDLRSYEHCSMGQIHQWSEVPGSLPLCESILVFENYPLDALREASTGLTFDFRGARSDGAQTKYPLTLLIGTGPELTMRCVYETQRLDSSDVTRMLEHLRDILESLAANPQQPVGEHLERIPSAQIPRVRPRPAPAREEASARAPARSATEARVAEIWREVLGRDDLGIDDSFLDLGGHSLTAMRMLSRLREAFAVELTLASLFEAPTIAKMAARIESARPPVEREVTLPLRRVARSDAVPLSFAQHRLWFLDQMEPGSPAYNVLQAFRIRGPLRMEALQGALDAILARHESLRTTFGSREGNPFQRIGPPEPVPLRWIDLREEAEPDCEAAARRLAAAEAERPFDLERGPLLRTTLLRVRPEDHVLLLAMHHIATDGWSLGIFLRELEALYSGFYDGLPARLPELSVQYADYAVWQREGLSGARLEKLLGYWRERLAGAPAVLDLPTDKLRPAVPSFRGDLHTRVLPRPATAHLRELARKEGVTPFTVVLAAFEVFLGRLARRTDIVVGTDVANRTMRETEGLIGFFVNLLVLRTSLSGNPSFRELLSRVRQTAFDAYAHADLPFEKLVEELRPQRMRGINPLVQVLVVQNPTERTLKLPGLDVEEFRGVRESSRFDLALFVSETEKDLRLTWLSSTDLFDPSTISGHAAEFERLLGRVVENPEARLDALERITREERGNVMEKRERSKDQPKGLRGARRQGMDISRAPEVTTGLLSPEHSLPLLLQPPAGAEIDLAEWARSRKDFLEQNLLERGAILFRGFGLKSPEEFERFASAICPELFGEYGDLPREGVAGKVYSSTPYPADETILYHNESSHLHRWPMKIWFFCVLAAERGGQTPIVDCRKVYQRLDPAIRDAFRERGLLYVRNYTAGMDVSWQTFFGTPDKGVVEEQCRLAGVESEWTSEGLRTRQLSPAVLRHPHTGETVFFNQLFLHHASCLAAPVRESLVSMLGEENLPRNVYYGDGSVIPDAVVAEVRKVYDELAVAFPWSVGDVVMLNNMLVAHARLPFSGPRKIVVAMGEMVNKSEVEDPRPRSQAGAGIG